MRFRHAVLALAAAAIVASCATTPQLDDRLKGLVGQNIDSAISKLGEPNSRQVAEGETVYVWLSNDNAAVPIESTDSGMGQVGGTPGYGATTTTKWVRVFYNCTVQIATDDKGKVKRYQSSGNEGGCANYAKTLKR